jgi:hypothetical protein
MSLPTVEAALAAMLAAIRTLPADSVALSDADGRT